MTASPLLIIHDCRRLPTPRKALADVARRIYRANGLPFGQQTHLVLCSDRVIRRLNRHHRHKDRPTDVLSFTYSDDDLLGEVYISLERAAVQAREIGHPYRSELVRLFVHGMHHLLGFDHQRRADRSAMELQERRYCRP